MMPTSQPTFLVRVLRLWIPMVAVSATILFTVYVLVQQSYRMGANDPQIQMAEDGAAAYSAGVNYETIPPTTKVDVATSLAPFVIVFHQNEPIAANVVLDGKTPVPPIGVFQYATQHEENRFTWQPRANVRIAAVLKKVSGNNAYFVLAGRSLREVEVREDNLGKLALIGFAASLVVSLLAVMATQALFPDTESTKDL